MKNLLLIFTLLLAATACKKEQADVVPKIPATVTELDPNEFYPVHTLDNIDAFISLTSYTTLAVQYYQKTEAQFSGNLKIGSDNICLGIPTTPGYNEQGNWVAQLAEKKCGSFSFNKDLFDIAGTNIIFSTTAQTFGKVLRFHIYKPENIIITQPLFTNDLTIAPGQTMTWTTDTKNQSHDILEITYDPGNGWNENLANAGHLQTITKKYRIHNTLGKYTFTQADFVGIPKGAHVDISLMRHNKLEHTDVETGKTYAIITGSMIVYSAVLDN